MRSAHNPGPTNDQEALQEEFLGALQALAGSAVNGRRMELLSWEEAPYEAVKASLLASGRVPTGRGRFGEPGGWRRRSRRWWVRLGASEIHANGWIESKNAQGRSLPEVKRWPQIDAALSN